MNTDSDNTYSGPMVRWAILDNTRVFGWDTPLEYVAIAAERADDLIGHLPEKERREGARRYIAAMFKAAGHRNGVTEVLVYLTEWLATTSTAKAALLNGEITHVHIILDQPEGEDHCFTAMFGTDVSGNLVFIEPGTEFDNEAMESRTIH